MGRLIVDGINPILATRGWRSLLWVIRGATWEVTCGSCRTRFTRMIWLFASSVDCPACGTRNTLSNAGWFWRPMKPK
jgi:hypothetical protein